MAISIDKQFGIHQHALQLRAERASVLANNIANADTPGYKARDIDFQDVLKARMGEQSESLSMQQSRSNHMNRIATPDAINGLKYRTPLHPAVDENTVDAHLEKTEFVNNSVGYQAAFQFLNGRIKSMLTAIKGQ